MSRAYALPERAYLVSAGMACARLRALLTDGWTVVSLAAASGVSEGALASLARGERRSCTAQTADAVDRLFVALYGALPRYRELCTRRSAGRASRTRLSDAELQRITDEAWRILNVRRSEMRSAS